MVKMVNGEWGRENRLGTTVNENGSEAREEGKLDRAWERRPWRTGCGPGRGPLWLAGCWQANAVPCHFAPTDKFPAAFLPSVLRLTL